MFASNGCRATVLNCVMLSDRFRLAHATTLFVALSVRQTPPSLAAKRVSRLLGLMAIQCVSACNPPLEPLPALRSAQVWPPSRLRQSVPPVLVALAEVP